MGADNARILVMVATAAVGSGLSQLLKVLPKLPGASQASELAVAEGGVSFEQAGAVEGVSIGKGGLTISLTTGAVLATSLSGNFGGGPRINLIRPTLDPEAEAIAKRIRALKKAGVRGNLDQLEERLARDPGAIGELETLERLLGEGAQGEDIEVLERSKQPEETSPDFRVREKIVEVKTRELPLSKRYLSDQVTKANAQFKGSGLSPEGHLEVQLRGEAARTATFEAVEQQVLKGLTPEDNTSVRSVAVYSNGRLMGEWIRTAGNAILRTFPPP